MKNFVTSAVLILAAASPAVGQELSYANVDVGLALASANDDDGTASILQGEVEYKMGQLFYGANLGFSASRNDFGDFDFLDLGVQLGYMPIDGMLVGAAFRQSNQSFSDSGGSTESEATETEIFGQFESTQFDVAVSVEERTSNGGDGRTFTELLGRASATPDVTVLASFDFTEDNDGARYRLGARYDAGPIEAIASYRSDTEADTGDLSIGGAYDVSDQFLINAEYVTELGSESDIAEVSLEAAYDINDIFTVKAGYLTLVGEDAFDASVFQVGADYAVGTDVTLSFVYFQQNFGSLEQSIVSVELSYEFGETARIDTRIIDDISVQSVFDGIFFY